MISLDTYCSNLEKYWKNELFIANLSNNQIGFKFHVVEVTKLSEQREFLCSCYSFQDPGDVYLFIAHRSRLPPYQFPSRRLELRPRSQCHSLYCSTSLSSLAITTISYQLPMPICQSIFISSISYWYLPSAAVKRIFSVSAQTDKQQWRLLLQSRVKRPCAIVSYDLGQNRTTIPAPAWGWQL